jgi:glycosyltransferase involved in cell wall biosynthesis
MSPVNQSAGVTFLQTAVPGYRVVVFRALAARFGEHFRVVAGSEYFDGSVKTAAAPDLPLTSVANRFLAGRRFLWQSGAWKACAGADVLVAELNPRILSTWLLLLARRARRRPTILWGHAWPRSGAHSGRDRVRNLMRSLADGVLVYSRTQADELRHRMPGQVVVAAPNALYARDESPGTTQDGRMCDFVFVGRLVEAKKPRVLIDAFALVAHELPAESCLVVVGDGPLREELAATAQRLPGVGRIELRGEVTDRAELERVFADALASVIPGYAGLSLTQSLWFGVPALIARDEPHSPEIEAAVPGVNAELFESDSPEALARALVAVSKERDAWIARRAAIAASCARDYSVDAMVDAMAQAVEEVLVGR